MCHCSLCALEDPSKPEPEDCFVPLKLVDGTTKSVVSPDVNYYINRIQLPHNVTCERCVFRWTYRAGTYAILLMMIFACYIFC